MILFSYLPWVKSKTYLDLPFLVTPGMEIMGSFVFVCSFSEVSDTLGPIQPLYFWLNDGELFIKLSIYQTQIKMVDLFWSWELGGLWRFLSKHAAPPPHTPPQHLTHTHLEATAFSRWM